MPTLDTILDVLGKIAGLVTAVLLLQKARVDLKAAREKARK